MARTFSMSPIYSPAWATTLWVINRLVVKTGSAKTKTKTANGSMKQNAHSSRKNYFYQKLP